jgi:hypothetical protein
LYFDDPLEATQVAWRMWSMGSDFHRLICLQEVCTGSLWKGS